MGCDIYLFDSEDFCSKFSICTDIYACRYHVNIFIDIIILVSNGCSSLKPKMWVCFFPFQKATQFPTHSRGDMQKPEEEHMLAVIANWGHSQFVNQASNAFSLKAAFTFRICYLFDQMLAAHHKAIIIHKQKLFQYVPHRIFISEPFCGSKQTH